MTIQDLFDMHTYALPSFLTEKLIPSEKTPKVIAAKINDFGWDVLHLHTPNIHDKLSTNYYYYYDYCGEEISTDLIEKYIVLER